MSHVGMARDGDHTRFVSALCALIRRLWTTDRRVQTHAVPSVKALSAERTLGAAERRVVRDSVDSGSSSSPSEGSGQGEKVGRSGSVGGGKGLPHAKVRDDGSRRSGSHEPDVAASVLEEPKVHRFW